MATLLITDYTSYDAVRAALGVSDEELEDSTLALEIYATQLRLDLEDIALDLPEVYASLPSSLSTSQDRFYATARLFATYAVARALTAALPLFSPKSFTDGKAGVARYADSPYRETIKSIEREFDRTRTRLERAYQAVATTTFNYATPIFFSVASPDSDPVTGV